MFLLVKKLFRTVVECAHPLHSPWFHLEKLFLKEAYQTKLLCDADLTICWHIRRLLHLELDSVCHPP